MHKKTKILPLPHGGRGSGGWGKEIKLKAGRAGDKEGKPPRRIPERQGRQATGIAVPPPSPQKKLLHEWKKQMDEKMKETAKKRREVLMYLLFGVLTTLVGWAVYFAILWTWRAAFGLAPDDTTGKMYLAGYTVAQVVQWIAAVLFAFFTNRKWVFTDADRQVSLPAQLGAFAGGRVATFFLDYLVTYFGARALTALLPALTAVSLLGRDWNLCDILAKVVAAIIVIIGNYIFSKLVVFRNRKEPRR